MICFLALLGIRPDDDRTHRAFVRLQPSWRPRSWFPRTLLLTLVGLVGCAPGQIDWAADPAEAGPVSVPDSSRRPDASDAAPDRQSESRSDSQSDSQSARALAKSALSNEAMVSLLRNFKYRGAGYRKVNDEPFPSIVSPGKTITLWISEEGYDDFTRVSPEHAGSQAELPVGAVVAREVFKDDVLDAITLMVRLPDGTFPLGGDWWYAAAAPDGKFKVDANTGAPLVGLLQDCGTCHLRRSADDHLFGTPDAYLP